jgi:hypothetical protein
MWSIELTCEKQFLSITNDLRYLKILRSQIAFYVKSSQEAEKGILQLGKKTSLKHFSFHD